MFSSLVLEPQDNFEVRIDAADPLYCGSLKIGLTTFSLSGKEKLRLIHNRHQNRNNANFRAKHFLEFSTDFRPHQKNIRKS